MYNPHNHKFSPVKKEYQSYQVSTGKAASIDNRVRVDNDTNANANELNQLIRELSSNTTNNFFNLYIKIIIAEKNENPHAVLDRYYFLGEELKKRFEHYKKVMNMKKLEAQLKVSNEVRAQLPKDITDVDIRKITDIARKTYNFFVRLSDDKDQRMAYVQRIKTFTANFISCLSSDNIEYVVSQINSK